MLVLVHGTPLNMSPEEFTSLYIHSRKRFAEEYNFILIAPNFTQADFSSTYGEHALTGSRGLFGREIGADD